MENTIKESIGEMRQDFDAMGRKYNVSRDVRVRRHVAGGVACYLFQPASVKIPGTVVLYLHGGCYALGSIASHKALVSHLCASLRVPVVFPEYSLSPEFPFPTALNEVLTLYSSLTGKGKRKVCLMGRQCRRRALHSVECTYS